jgi:hypothetical protein
VGKSGNSIFRHNDVTSSKDYYFRQLLACNVQDVALNYF